MHGRTSSGGRIRALILIRMPAQFRVSKLIFGRQHFHTIERWSMYRHILIPTDGSEVAEHAVTNGLSLAKSVGAKVTVIIVEEPNWFGVSSFAEHGALEELS